MGTVGVSSANPEGTKGEDNEQELVIVAAGQRLLHTR